jgi:hypothetical protein
VYCTCFIDLFTRRDGKRLPHFYASIVSGNSAMSILLRLSSFANWPTDAAFASPVVLANAGFMYSGHGDKVACPICRIEIQGRRRDEFFNPSEEHRRRSPQCSLAVACSPPGTCSWPPENALGASHTKSVNEDDRPGNTDAVRWSSSPTDAAKTADSADCCSRMAPSRGAVVLTEGAAGATSETVQHAAHVSAGTSDGGPSESMARIRRTDESVQGIDAGRCVAAAATDEQKLDDEALQRHIGDGKCNEKADGEATSSDDGIERCRVLYLSSSQSSFIYAFCNRRKQLKFMRLIYTGQLDGIEHLDACFCR